MLLEKPRAAGDIVTMKLSSGEEVIARFEKEKPEGIEVSKPMALSVSPQGIGLMPFMFTLSRDLNITIKSSNITVIVNTDDEFAKQYMSSTTGIQMA